MATAQWTLLYDGKAITAPLEQPGDMLLLSPADLQSLLGWQVKDNTLCNGDRCLPLSLHPQLLQGDRVDLVALAALQQMPLAVDVAARVLSVGDSVEE